MWHAATLAELCARPATSAEPYWSTAFAVGTPKWLSGLGGERMNLAEYIEPVGGDGEDDLHALRLPQSVAARLWRWLGNVKIKF